MTKMMIAVLAAMMLAGCTVSTGFGQCVGVTDTKDPSKLYKISIVNVVLAVVFLETVIVPIVVLADQTYCPVGLTK